MGGYCATNCPTSHQSFQQTKCSSSFQLPGRKFDQCSSDNDREYQGKQSSCLTYVSRCDNDKILELTPLIHCSKTLSSCFPVTLPFTRITAPARAKNGSPSTNIKISRNRSLHHCLFDLLRLSGSTDQPGNLGSLCLEIESRASTSGNRKWLVAEYSNKFFGEGNRNPDSDCCLECPVLLRGDSVISISGSKGLIDAPSVATSRDITLKDMICFQSLDSNERMRPISRRLAGSLMYKRMVGDCCGNMIWVRPISGSIIVRAERAALADPYASHEPRAQPQRESHVRR